MQEAANQLKLLLMAGNKDAAGVLLRSLGAQAGDTLLEASGGQRAPARTLALELAAENPSPGSCRTILARLSDSNASVRSLAGNLIGQCRDRQNAPDLTHALEQEKEPATRRALVGQLGVAGGPDQIPLLRRLTRQPSVAGAAWLALAQLGDAQARRQLIERLQDPDAQARTGALRDSIAVRDAQLAAWFGPALADWRDAVPITGPHEGPTVYARVCDFAVLAMAQLGYRFSFPVEFLERLSLEQIEEARAMVDAMPREMRPNA